MVTFVGIHASVTNEAVNRVTSAIRRRLGLPNRWVERRMLGRTLVVREGTLQQPHVADYDDAWLHACAQHAESVFDVGANVGQSALLMLLSGAKRVVLVDANWQALS